MSKSDKVPAPPKGKKNNGLETTKALQPAPPKVFDEISTVLEARIQRERQEARREGLEAAAKVCSKLCGEVQSGPGRSEMRAAYVVAMDRIRALKDAG